MQCELGVLRGGDYPNSQPSRCDVKHPVTDAIVPRRLVRDLRLACGPRGPANINHSVAASCQKQCHWLADLHEKLVAPSTILLTRIFKIFAGRGLMMQLCATAASVLPPSITQFSARAAVPAANQSTVAMIAIRIDTLRLFASLVRSLERLPCRGQNKSRCTINAARQFNRYAPDK